jgi:hypothetical protein
MDRKMKKIGTLVSIMVLLMSPSLFAATLHIQVVDEAGKPLWARLEVRGAGGKMYEPADALRDLQSGTSGMEPYYRGSFIIKGDCQIEVPPGHYLVVGMHGTEYGRFEKPVTVAAEGVTNVTVSLRPWIQMWKKGWWSGDMHIHRPPADVEKAVLAEDLNFAPVITGWGGKNYQFNAGDIYAADAKTVEEIDDHHFITLRNTEDERGGGAWLFFELHAPLQGREGWTRWWPPVLSLIHQARDQRAGQSIFPWVETEKPFFWEAPVVMALSPSDSMELIPNHITEYGLEAMEGAGRPFLPKYHNRELWMDDVLAIYYHYLNLGMHIAPTAGSASGVLPNPIGQNRVYANFSGPFSVEKWFGAIREGHSFATNGPMLFFNVKQEGTMMKASVEAHAGGPLDRIEIVANGEVVEWFPVPAGAHDYQGEFTFDPQKYSWIAARCYLPGGDTLRLAHSSPYYLPGHYDCKADAQYYIDWMNELIQKTKDDPKSYPSPTELGQKLDMYAQALAFYQQKLDQGCGGN